MVARVKDRGLLELDKFKTRVQKVRSMKRLKGVDAQWLIEHVEEIERYVARMDEAPFKEKEIW